MDNIQQALLSQVTAWLPKVGLALLLAFLFWLVIVLLRKVIYKVSQEFSLDESLTALLVRALRVTLIIFAVITVLGTLGINVAALVAGLGLTGFALGFALKDTISNLIAGVLILLYRPFTVGHQIIIAGFSGQVVSIDLRYTILEHEAKKILIPNAKLFTDPITVIDDEKQATMNGGEDGLLNDTV